jgi:peptidoglycan/LPS O-acetylase OafA/YrhL
MMAGSAEAPKADVSLQYFEQLDGFRFLSIIAVMVSHFLPFGLVDRLPLGYGVMFFFVLSSFLITRILLIAKYSSPEPEQGNIFILRQFYLRRFLRIFPIYYLLVLVTYVYNWSPSREIFFSLITYTTNFRLGNGFDGGSFTHLWSLAVEEQFYIFFPFILLFTPRRHIGPVLILFTIAGIIGRAVLYFADKSNVPFWNYHTLSCLDSLGVGGILAYMSVFKVDKLRLLIANKVLFASAAILFVMIMLFSYSIPTGAEKYKIGTAVFMRVSFNVLSFWLLGWAVVFKYRGIAKRFLEFKPIVFLGRISYGMYLYHLFVPSLVAKILAHLGMELFTPRGFLGYAVLFLLYSVITIIISICSWYIVEQPLNSLKKYFTYSKRPELKLSVQKTVS